MNARRVSAFMIAAMLLSSTVAQVMGPLAASAAPNDPTFSVVGTHPEALAQSTQEGSAITDIAVEGDKLYLSYGDYANNTGPIVINPFDTDTNTFGGSLLSVPTETLMTMRKINGKLYAPMIDPQVPSDQKAGYATNKNGTWQNVNATEGVHFFDIATLDGDDLWLVGASMNDDFSAERGATAWRSTDDGATWNIVQTDQSSSPNGYERYYWVAELNGKIYMQAESVVPGAPLRIFDGSTWTTGTTSRVCGPGDSGKVEVFKEKLYCASDDADVRVFDGTTTSQVETGIGAIKDFYSDDTALYAIGSYGVARTANGSDWTVLASLESIGLYVSDDASIAVHDDYLYVGKAGGELLKSDTTISDMQFTPYFTSVSPRAVPVGMANAAVEIYGENFSPSSVLRIDGVIVSAQAINPNLLRFLAPVSSAARSVDVTVSNGTDSYTLANGLTYAKSGSGQYSWVNGPAYPGVANWNGLAVSGDGSTAFVSSSDYAHRSANAGGNWSIAGGVSFMHVASSIDGKKVVGATSSGYVYISADSGQTWSIQESLRSGSWGDVAISDDGSVIYVKSTAYSAKSEVQRSVDGGQTWQALPTQMLEYMDELSVSADGQYLVIPTKDLTGIMVSDDFGQTWVKRSFGGDNGFSDLVLSADGQTIVMTSGTGDVLRSSDAGVTWTTTNIGSNMLGHGKITGSADASKLTIVFTDKVFRSTDAGATWQEHALAFDGTYVRLVSADDGERIYLASGTSAPVRKSVDGGLTWQELEVPLGSEWGAADATSDNRLILTTRPVDESFNSIVELYDQYGAHLVKTMTLPTGYYGGVAISDDGQKMAVTEYGGSIYISDDAGESWTAQDAAGTGAWRGIKLSSDGSTILAMQFPGVVAVSKDGGESWQNQDVGFSTWLNASVSGSGNKMVVVSSPGDMRVSDDDGLSVEHEVSFVPAEGWRSAAIADNGTIIAQEKNGSVFLSKNNGATWQKQDALGMGSWNQVAITDDAKTLIVSGYDGTFVSHDSGVTWTPQIDMRASSDVALLISQDGLRLNTYSQGKVPYIGTRIVDQIVPMPGGTQGGGPTSTKPSMSKGTPGVSTDPTYLASKPSVSLSDVPGQDEGKVALPGLPILLNEYDAFMRGSGQTLEMMQGGMVTYRLDGVLYKMYLESMAKDGSSATLTLLPDTEMNLTEGKSVKRDLDGDGVADVSFRLVSSDGKTAEINFAKITSADNAGSDNSKMSILPTALTLVVIIVIATITWAAFARHRRMTS